MGFYLPIYHSADTICNTFFNFQLEKKLASRLLVIIGIWIAGWTPFSIISILQLIGYGHTINSNLNIAAMMACKLSSVSNTVLYGMRLPKFRKKIVRLLSCVLPHELSIVDSSTQVRRRFEVYRHQGTVAFETVFYCIIARFF